jgi:hypothetical protein
MFRRAPRAKAKSRSLMSARTQLGRAAASSTERNCCGAGDIRYARFPGVGMTAVAVIGKAAIGQKEPVGECATIAPKLVTCNNRPRRLDCRLR